MGRDRRIAYSGASAGDHVVSLWIWRPEYDRAREACHDERMAGSREEQADRIGDSRDAGLEIQER